MSTPTVKQEIDFRTIRLIVGLVALSLAGLTSYFSSTPLTSISASYYEGGWSRSIFIGFLFAIAAFLLAYNGHSRTQMILSKVAAVAALGIALFPCRCGSHPEIIPNVHGISAAIMFIVLAYFCYAFLTRAWAKGNPQARARAIIYAVCGIAITAALLVLTGDRLSGGAFSAHIPRLTFYGEGTGLIAFGTSWLTASRIFPLLTARVERFSPLARHNPA